MKNRIQTLAFSITIGNSSCRPRVRILQGSRLLRFAIVRLKGLWVSNLANGYNSCEIQPCSGALGEIRWNVWTSQKPFLGQPWIFDIPYIDIVMYIEMSTVYTTNHIDNRTIVYKQFVCRTNFFLNCTKRNALYGGGVFQRPLHLLSALDVLGTWSKPHSEMYFCVSRRSRVALPQAFIKHKLL